MATTTSQKRASEGVEAEWKLPSFGRQLFLGDFRLDLIYPQPRLDPEAVEKGERFLARLREFLETEVDPLEIERDAKIPDRVLDGLKAIGALGMKVTEEYGGLGLSQVYYNRALGACRCLAFVAWLGTERAPVDRCGGAAADVRQRGAEAQVAAAGRQGPHQRVLADRA